MAREKKQEECKRGSPEYMLTYGDMMTLLLCFFVMLLAMSTIDPNRFMVAASSFQNAFSGVLKEFPTIPIHKNILVPQMGGDEQNKRMAIEAARQLQESIKREELDESIKVKVTDKGIAIKVADPIGFDIGKADIKPEFAGLLAEVINIVNTKMPESEIRVEGHTDNVPIHTREYPSNWELSAARALHVVKFMFTQGGIDPARLSAVGYGEYRPIAPNDREGNRQKNRRIEIYVEYLQKEVQ